MLFFFFKCHLTCFFLIVLKEIKKNNNTCLSYVPLHYRLYVDVQSDAVQNQPVWSGEGTVKMMNICSGVYFPVTLYPLNMFI